MSRVGDLLRQRDFRLLWFGQSLSSVGDQMIVVVLALYVVETTGSARDLGFVLAAQTLPLVVFLLVGGVWADRVPRNRIMIATDLVRAAVQITIAILVFAGRLPIWLLIVLVTCFGAAEAFFRPAYTGLVPQTVPEGSIQHAQALTNTANTVARFVGPSLATLLALGAGFGWAYLFDAATFVVSAVLLAGVRPRERGPARDLGERASMRHELAEGFREVRQRAWVWVTLLSAMAFLFVGLAPFVALGAAVARDEYGATSVFGWVVAANGVGSFLGALLSMRWRPVRPMLVATVLLLVWPVANGSFALGVPLGVVVPFAVMSGMSFGLFLVWWETALAERIPPDALSRVSSYDWMVSLALLPVGYLLAGVLSSAVAASTILAVGSMLAFIATAAALLSRDLRQLGADDGVAAR